MVNVNSNVKLITSNTVPTTSSLPNGNMAFGQIDGENRLFGTIGSQVVEFTANGEPIIYFVDEDELNTFLAGTSVPTGGWYAAVAEQTYVQSVLQVGNAVTSVINGGTDLKLTKTNDHTIHMDYGDYTTDASGGNLAVRSRVSADIIITVIQETRNPNNSVTAIVNCKYTNFGRRMVSENGVWLNAIIHIYNSDQRTNEVFMRSDNIIGGSKTYPDVSFNTVVTIPPQQTVVVGVGRYWNDIDGSSSDDEFTGGLQLTNPLEAV